MSGIQAGGNIFGTARDGVKMPRAAAVAMPEGLTMQTVTLRNGTRVLARMVDGHLYAYHYMSRAQAEKRAATIPGAVVIRPTRTYFVAVPA
jgi:hypothetical protein